LANKEYVKSFQGKTLMTDINKDGKNDLIMWDKNNVYLKYRNNNSEYNNLNYNNKYYKYSVESYQKLLDDSEDGFIKINDIHVKLCDWDWEVKNFKYS
jgi:PDZ domain-containing secreted protein